VVPGLGPFCHKCSAASADGGGTNTAAFEPQGQSSSKQDSSPKSSESGVDSNGSLESNEGLFMLLESLGWLLWLQPRGTAVERARNNRIGSKASIKIMLHWAPPIWRCRRTSQSALTLVGIRSENERAFC
jgi:hypothetical protein